jgi:hypothetical protein
VIKILLAFALFIFFFTACKKDSSVVPDQASLDDAGFNRYEAHFLDELWKLNPDWATGVGYHKYDSLLLIPNKQNREKLLTFTKVQMDSLGKFNPNNFLEVNKMDFAMMQNQLAEIQWKIGTLKDYEWDPNSYNVIGSFATILNEHYEPLTQRLNSFYQKMAFIPAYYKEAEKQIKNPVVELTNLAIEQHLGGIGVIEKDFADSLKKTNIPDAQKKLMLDRAKLSADAIKEYTEFLKNLKNDHPRSFRLGKELYEDKFKYEIQSSLTAQQIYNAAVERKKYLHHEMAKFSKQLWPKYFGTKPMPADSLDLIGQMIDTLSAKHVAPDEFQEAIEKQIPKLTAFVK